MRVGTIENVRAELFPTLSRTSFWRLRKDPAFPPVAILGGRKVIVFEEAERFRAHKLAGAMVASADKQSR